MAATGVYAHISSSTNTNPSAPLLTLDALLDDANNGVRFLFDLGFPWSYPGGYYTNPQSRPAATYPSNNQTVYDMSGLGNNATATIGGGSLGYQGNGFDLSPVTSSATGVLAPATVLSDIYNTVNGASQQFLVVGYFKLPSLANWNTSGSLATLISASSNTLGYQVAPDIVNIAMGGGIQLTSRRQTAINTNIISNIQIANTSSDFGNVVQLAYYNNGTTEALTYRTVNGRVTTSQASGVQNTQNYSSLQMQWGVCKPFTIINSSIKSFYGVRIYRGWIENLARSQRDPIQTLENDWNRVYNRAVFS